MELNGLCRVAALLFVAGLAACATPADPVRMVAQPEAGVGDFPASLHGAMCVGTISGGEPTNPMWVSQVGNPEFRQALAQSMLGHGLLAAADACRFKVDANLLGLSQPVFGLALEVTSHVNYTVAAPGHPPLLLATVSAPYTAAFSDAAIAVMRLKLANEGSIRRNISMFLARLRQSSPMPGRPQ